MSAEGEREGGGEGGREREVDTESYYRKSCKKIAIS